MLVFVVPLQSPAVSKDWRKVSLLAQRTLRSICRQTSEAFRVVLVCNRRPDGDFTHPALTVIEEDFPLPNATTEERMIDKGRKIQRGLVHARAWAPFHLMCTDADDCVSRRLAAFVSQHPAATGWFFQTGYLHDAGSRFVFRRPNFHLLCGTSHIVRCEQEDLPENTAQAESDFWVLKHGHPTLEEFLRGRGTPLQPLPFPGALYLTATGENYSGIALANWRGKRMLLEKLRRFRWLTRKLRDEFGHYEIDR